VDGSCADPAVVGVYVDVAAAHDGDNVSASEAVAVFEDRRDAERGRRFGDEAGVVKEHPHTSDDRRLLDPDGVVSDQVSRYSCEWPWQEFRTPTPVSTPSPRASTATVPWSSGVVEGHVNRIKMLKRQMFGRAGFNLLRKRVLLA
jgi:hypothetical protein